MTGPGQTLFEFVRYWSRRWADDDVLAEQGRMVLVTEAANTTARREGATINAIAGEIGIDQSGASRLVKSAITADYLRMRTSDTDRRRREVAVTPAGHQLLAEAHHWQEEMFDQLSQGWSQERREDFHRAMTSLLWRSFRLDD